MNGTSKIPSIEELRTAAASAGRETGCRLLVLFGSATRPGAQTPQDVDLAVLAEGRVDTVELTNRLIRALGFQAVDIADLNHADPLLMMLVARDGVPLYESSPGEFDRFVSLAVRRYADTRKFRAMEAQEVRDFIAAGQPPP